MDSLNACVKTIFTHDNYLLMPALSLIKHLRDKNSRIIEINDVNEGKGCNELYIWEDRY